MAATLKQGAHPLAPFHWEIEFPEVFARENGGFDAIVGNPPFAGKNTVAASNRRSYGAWLQALHTEAHGNADLVVALLSTRLYTCAPRRVVRPNSHKYSKPRRYSRNRPAVDFVSMKVQSTGLGDELNGRAKLQLLYPLFTSNAELEPARITWMEF